MSKEKLKKELHDMIDKIQDEATLNMVKEEIEAYQKADIKFDDLSDLTPEERAELEELINEDPEKDIVSEEEFKDYIKEWRKKLSIKSGS